MVCKNATTVSERNLLCCITLCMDSQAANSCAQERNASKNETILMLVFHRVKANLKNSISRQSLLHLMHTKQAMWKVCSMAMQPTFSPSTMRLHLAQYPYMSLSCVQKVPVSISPAVVHHIAQASHMVFCWETTTRLSTLFVTRVLIKFRKFFWLQNNLSYFMRKLK